MASKNRTAKALSLGLFVVPVAGFGLTPMDEHSMSQVSGRDGLTLNYENASGITLQQMSWVTDGGTADSSDPQTVTCAGGVNNRHACTHFQNAALTGTNGNPITATYTVDVANDGVDPILALHFDWDEVLYTLGGMTLQTPTNPGYATNSLGQMGLYSQGSLDWINTGFFGDKARLDFDLSGDWIYRQGAAGSPELSYGNLKLRNYFSNGPASGHTPGTGTIGIDSQGLFMAADFTYTDLQFDLMYNASPDSAGFDRSANRKALLYAGWIGGLKDAFVRVGAGGIGYGNNGTYLNVDGTALGTRSEGLNVLAQWDYDTDFKLHLGHADGNKTQLQMGDWRHFGGTASPMLSMNIILDALQNNSGPAGLCFGGGFAIGAGSPIASTCNGAGGTFYNTRVASGDSAFAIFLRDSYLHGYSETISVLNPTSSYSQTFDWGLVLTLGKLDADILAYPKGPAGNVGVTLDATVMVQSPGFWEAANSNNPATRAAANSNWATNSHFLLADTDQRLVVGLMNTDILWMARDLSLTLGSPDSAFSGMSDGMLLRTDTLSRYLVRGVLGAGNLDNLGTGTGNVALWNFDLSTDQFRFVLYPTTVDGLATMGFDGYMHLDGNANLSLAEVSSPQSAFQMYDVRGSLGWRNGNLTVRAGDETSDGLPSLTIENELLLGESANFGTAGQPLVGSVGFGDQNYGQMAMPGGVWHSEIIAKIPQ